MLTKAEMDERLAALKPEHGFSRTTEWSLVDREREALETAKQLAEWLGKRDAGCDNWRGSSCPDCEMRACCYWLEGRDECR